MSFQRNLNLNWIQSSNSNHKRANNDIAKYDIEISDLVRQNLLKVGDILVMSYKPRNGFQKS